MVEVDEFNKTIGEIELILNSLVDDMGDRLLAYQNAIGLLLEKLKEIGGK